MRKILSKLSMPLIFILVMSLFVGCGPKEDPVKEPEDTVKVEVEEKDEVDKVEEEEKEAPGEVELTLWTTTREQDGFEEEMEEKFLEEHPHITLNKVLKEGDPGNEFYQGVAAGNAPDLIDVSFTMMDQYMKAGILEPINGYLEEWEHAGGLDDYYLDMFTDGGDIYGLPTHVAPMFFGYNKTLFEENDIDGPPETWEEAIEFGKKINDPDNQVNGYSTLTAEWTEWFFQYYVWQAGGNLANLNDDGTITLTFDDPAVIDASNYYKDLVAEGVLHSDLTLKFDDLVERFAAGKIGMMPFAGDWISWAASLGMDPSEIGLAVMPKGPAESATAIAGTVQVINAGTTDEKKDAAWEYIAFYSDPENIKKDYENKENKGAINPMIIPRTDLELGDIVEMPEEYSQVLREVAENGRLEFPGKAQIGIYVDRVVQKLIMDPNSDPLKEFEKAQEMAEKEVMDEYNEEILAK